MLHFGQGYTLAKATLWPSLQFDQGFTLAKAALWTTLHFDLAPAVLEGDVGGARGPDALALHLLGVHTGTPLNQGRPTSEPSNMDWKASSSCPPC